MNMQTVNRRMTFCKALAVSMLVALAACSGDPRPLEEAVEVNEIGMTRLLIDVGTQLTEDIYINPTEQLKFDFTAYNAAADELVVENTDRRWTVSDSNVASITDAGLLTGLANGQIEVGINIGGIAAVPVTIFVSDAELASIDRIDGPASLTECSKSTEYSAIGTFTDTSERALKNVTWSLADPESGVLLNTDTESTVVGSLSAGSITLQATEGNISGTVDIQVAADAFSLAIFPASLTIERTVPTALVARATYSDSTAATVSELATWTLDDDNGVATLTQTAGNTGIITGLLNESTSVTAVCGEQSANAFVTVVEPDFERLEITASEDPLIIRVTSSGEQLEAIASTVDNSASANVTDTVSWEIQSGSEFLEISNSGNDKGFIKPIAAGRAVVKATYAGDISDNLTVTVSP